LGPLAEFSNIELGEFDCQGSGIAGVPTANELSFQSKTQQGGLFLGLLFGQAKEGQNNL